MPANTNPIFPATVRTVGTAIIEEDAGIKTNIFVSGFNGSQVIKIIACNTHATEPIDVTLYIQPAESTDIIYIPCGTVTLPARAGYDAAAVSVLPTALLDADDKLLMAKGAMGPSFLSIAPDTAMPTNMTVNVLVMGSDY